VEGGLWKMVHLSLWEVCYGNVEALKKALEIDTSFHGSLVGKSGRRLKCWGLMCGRRFRDGCLSL
jgi:hypothetical protein